MSDSARQKQEQAKSKLVRSVQLRRGDKVLNDVPVKTLVAGIKKGKLQRTDEFSSNGEHWMALGKHHQLVKIFDEIDPPPLHIEREFTRLVDLLKEIND